MNVVVEVQGLVKRYGDLTAVDRVSFSAYEGEVFALLGPNGAGKTSTIRVLMGILFPDEGKVSLFGKPPRLVRDKIGYLPEERGLYRDISLLEQLVYFGVLKGMRPSDASDSALRWLRRFDLEDWANRKVHELSHGMQQKAQLVAALMHDPPIVILDEPFQGLDPVNIQIVKELIAGLRNDGKTIILSSHQLVHVEALADRVALIARGRIVAHGTMDELKRRYARGEIAVRLTGDFPLPERLPIEGKRKQDGVWYLSPAPSIAPRDLLRVLVEENAPLEKFEVVYPSLEEIFLRAVEEMETREVHR